MDILYMNEYLNISEMFIDTSDTSLNFLSIEIPFRFHIRYLAQEFPRRHWWPRWHVAFLQEFDLFQDILKFNMGKIDADNKGRLGAGDRAGEKNWVSHL